MLVDKIKQLADQVLDKHATVQSVADHVGPWKNEEGSSECELTPRDGDFRAGYIEIDLDHGPAHLPVAARRLDSLNLTLAKDAGLTADVLEPVFGKWHAVPPPPSGNPYSVVFYYPNTKAMFRVTVNVELNGPPQEAATRVTSFSLHRDDVAEVMRESR